MSERDIAFYIWCIIANIWLASIPTVSTDFRFLAYFIALLIAGWILVFAPPAHADFVGAALTQANNLLSGQDVHAQAQFNAEHDEDSDDE